MCLLFCETAIEVYAGSDTGGDFCMTIIIQSGSTKEPGPTWVTCPREP